MYMRDYEVKKEGRIFYYHSARIVKIKENQVTTNNLSNSKEKRIIFHSVSHTRKIQRSEQKRKGKLEGFSDPSVFVC